MIAIIDYGMGNLASVAKAFRFLGVAASITSDPRDLNAARAIVLPGVGAFGEAMRELKKRKLIAPIVGFIREDKPFLGLCLGLQLLFETSEESPGVKGFGILPGCVHRLPKKKGLKVPHMGWNQIEKVSSIKRQASREGLLKGVPDGAFMYFVHSFYAQPIQKKHVVATTRYGLRFPSVLWNGKHLWASQFHPEKSQRWGLKILQNFIHEVSLC